MKIRNLQVGLLEKRKYERETLFSVRFDSYLGTSDAHDDRARRGRRTAWH